MKKISLGLINDDTNAIYTSSKLYEKENNATSLEIIIPTDLQGYKYKLAFLLPDSTVTVTSELIPVENIITYNIGSALTSKIGNVAFEFHVYNDAGLLCKIGKYMVKIQDAIDIPVI